MSYRKAASSVYFSDIFTKTKITINRIAKTVEKRFPECGGIVAADGISGASLVIPVALKLDLPFGFVRNKSSHSSQNMEYHLALKDVVIIDDFIDKGRTMTKTCKKLLARDIMPIGIVCYGGTSYHNRAMQEWGDFRFFKDSRNKKPTLIIPQWRP